MALYKLLPMETWSGLDEGNWFQLGRRTRWKATLRVARLSAGGSITVVLETNPTLDSGSWVQIAAFPIQTTEGEVTLDSVKATSPDFTIASKNKWIRARISAIVGQVAAEVEIQGRFIDLNVEAEAQLVMQDIVEYSAGRDRIMNQAEADVIQLLYGDRDTGELNIDLEIPEVHERIQQEIAREAAHLWRREVLGRSHEPSAIVALREMPVQAPGLGRGLMKFMPSTAVVWFGR